MIHGKKGQINIFVIFILVLIVLTIIFYVGWRLYESNIKELQDINNKNNIEYQLLKNMIYDYYSLPDNNLRNQIIDTKLPCWNNTRAFSQNGLIEYDVQCQSNITYVKIPILYYDHNTTFYLYNGTVFTVILNSLKNK